MSNASPIIFVLWGHCFDESAAVIFTTELRRQGLCVKIVGLEGRPTAGACGLVLTPDLVLGQIPRLAQRVTCVIVPAPLESLLHFGDDPRLTCFLQEAVHRDICFIVSADAVSCQANTPLTAAQVFEYPARGHLVAFASALANRLAVSAAKTAPVV